MIDVAEHPCTEPEGDAICMVCHSDDGAPGRPPKTFILADNYAQARAWCRREGVRVYARSTVIATRGPSLRGYRVRDEDRVVFLGIGPTREVLEDLEIAQAELPVEARPTVEYVE